MISPGSLVAYPGDGADSPPIRAFVLSVSSYERMAKVVLQDGRVVEVPDDIDQTPGFVLVGNPSLNWHSISVTQPVSPRHGRVTAAVLVVAIPTGGVRRITLTHHTEWFATAPRSIFLNPTVKVPRGAALHLTWAGGKQLAIQLPPVLMTLAKKQEVTLKANPPKESELSTRYNRKGL